MIAYRETCASLRATTAGLRPVATTARALDTRTLTSSPATIPRDLQLVGLATKGALEGGDLLLELLDLGDRRGAAPGIRQGGFAAFDQPVAPVVVEGAISCSIAATKNRNVAVVAVARELAGFIRGLMTDRVEVA